MHDSLNKLYVEVTTACNLDCVMCVRRAWDEPMGTMPLAAFARLMEQVRELPTPPKIHLSGFGEPMVHPHFLEIVRLAKSTGAWVEMTSNGMLLDAETAQALIDLDLNRLVVSVDGANAARFEQIRERADFELVIRNLRRLKTLRLQQRGRHGNPQLALAFVAMRDNIDDLPNLPALAIQVGAWEILVSNVVPHTPEMEAQILYRESMNAVAYRGSRWAPSLDLPRLDMGGRAAQPVQDVFGSTASMGILGHRLSDRTDYCTFAQEGFAVVGWDGSVSPCLSLLHSHPEYIRGRRKQIDRLIFGNVNETTVGDLWASAEYTDFRGKLRDFPFSPCSTCGGCERFAANYEDCSDNTFPTCGACLWAQGFVQCA